MSTTSDKIRAHFRRFPNADVKKAAEKFNTALPRIYKLRKEVHEDIANELRREEDLETVKREKVTLNAAQFMIAKKLGIDPFEYARQLAKVEAEEPPLDVLDESHPEWTAQETESGDIVATLTERGKRYGKFKDHAEVTQKLKFILRMHMGSNYDRMEPDQIEALEMICHKLGRIANGDPNYADSWVDIAGYAKLVSDRLEGVER